MKIEQLLAESVDAFIVGFNTSHVTKPRVLTDEAKATFTDLRNHTDCEYTVAKLEENDNPLFYDEHGLNENELEALLDVVLEGVDEGYEDNTHLFYLRRLVTFCKLHVPTGIVYVDKTCEWVEEALDGTDYDGVEYKQLGTGFFAALLIPDEATTRDRWPYRWPDESIEYHKLVVEQGELVHYAGEIELVEPRPAGLHGTWDYPAFSVKHVAGTMFVDEDGGVYKLTQLINGDGLFMVRDYSELYRNPVATEQGFLLVRDVHAEYCR